MKGSLQSENKQGSPALAVSIPDVTWYSVTFKIPF